MGGTAPQVLGSGYAVPSGIRGNADPIFSWLQRNQPPGTDLFTGYGERRVLAPGEDFIATTLLPAAKAALAAANVQPAEIDLLLGTVTVSDYAPPNALSLLHARLGLSPRCWPVAVANDFSNFNAGLLFADAMIRAGRAAKALVCIGSNWSRYVDYHTPQAISAGDGAGAVVVGLGSGGWRVVDHEVLAATGNYGTMTMQPGAVPLDPPVQGYSALYTAPAFRISAAGNVAFKVFGGQQSPQAVLALLERNGLKGSDISLIAHQASTVLTELWQKTIGPAQYLSTLSCYGNMTAATLPVTLAWAERNGGIAKDRLVLFALAPDMHAHALLLQRD